ncbi:MAG: Actin- protein 10 [Pleopsidium flavum]|nr:MAG: Actin- protein 10 [Pleopsidium flavum]
MTAAAGYFDRKPTSSIRPGLSTIQQSSTLPGSPHTPQRTISSAFSSPSASYRAEDDALVFELGTRHFSAGFAGESAPRCTLGFGPEDARRVGDYRRWQTHYKRRTGGRKSGEEWGQDYELWRMDLRGIDLGLVDDKIERAVREAYTKYLLLDQKPRRLMLVLPPVMPHPLLASILTTLFTNFQYSSITLLSTSILTAVAAGLRSALVVDIGWAETLVTGIFEYREVHHTRSTRAVRTMSQEMGKLLSQELRKVQDASDVAEVQNGQEEEASVVDLAQCEEVMGRMAWCRTYEQSRERDTTKEQTASASPASGSMMSVALSVGASQTILQMPFSAFANPVESALFATNCAMQDVDDHEQPIHFLAYKALLHLPLDVRGICTSRIVVTGGGSHFPGVKERIVDEVNALVQARGWDPVRGVAADVRRERLKKASCNRQVSTKAPGVQKTTEYTDEPDSEARPVSAALANQEKDPVQEKLYRDQAKTMKPQVSGVVRGIESLGAWAGGSLVAALRVKGIVEIDKERFLQHGLAGASKDPEVSVVPQRQSFGPGLQRGTAGDRSSWTLGAWA